MSNSFGERLNELINDTVKKKVLFAQSIHVDQSYISQIVSGKKIPSDRVISDICRVYGVSEAWLRYGEPPKMIVQDDSSLDEIAKSQNLSSQDVNIIKGLIQLDTVQRNMVLSMLRGLVDDPKK